MRRALASVALASVVAAGFPAVSAAFLPPELVGSVGGAFGAPGAPGGGSSLTLAALWRFEGPLAFGPMVFVDDLGDKVGRLKDPRDGTDVGSTQLDHRFTYGGAWRLDMTAAGIGGSRAWQPFAGFTWGVYRVQGDRLGVVNQAASATGASAGLGIRYVSGHDRGAAPGAGVGLSIRHHRVFDERLRSYSSVAVDWSWPLGAGAPRVAGK